MPIGVDMYGIGLFELEWWILSWKLQLYQLEIIDRKTQLEILDLGCIQYLYFYNYYNTKSDIIIIRILKWDYIGMAFLMTGRFMLDNVFDIELEWT